jgi:iron complex outermembrane receptor protein
MMSRAQPYFTGATMTRALLFALLATTATSVWAQRASDDTSAEKRRQREEIVVTGRRPDGYRAIEAAGTRDGATLLETPQSVQVLTEELLRDQRADTFSALANVPSVRNAAPVNFDGVRVLCARKRAERAECSAS